MQIASRIHRSDPLLTTILLTVMVSLVSACTREEAAPPRSQAAASQAATSGAQAAAPQLKAAEQPTADQPAPTHTLPDRVFVKPVFLVPTDAQPPSDEYKQLLVRHLEWTQRRYRELLLGRDTFSLATGDLPLVLRGKHSSEWYKATSDQGAEAVVLELFEHDKMDRFSCPFIYVVLFVGTDQWPAGGGTPFNGHVNTGGGLVVLAAEGLVKNTGFQSCLQHEIGHAFGLVHADANGFDMRGSESLMSYNPAHHTKGFEPSATPGKLLPEDLRLLSFNRRVFPAFTLEPDRDFPSGYQLNPQIALLGQMTLTGQPEYRGNWKGE
jgi:hypothetical protein